MSAVAGAGRLSPRGVVRRRMSVVVELIAAVAVCFAGYYGAANWFRVHEAAWAVGVLHGIGVADVSAILPGHILMFHGPGVVMDGVVTTACSSILSIVGLTALTVTVLRTRRLHAFLGLVAAIVAVVAANVVRLGLSALAGVTWGSPALALFHAWVGTLWTLASTLAGFLLMVHLAARRGTRRAGRSRKAHRRPAERLGPPRPRAQGGDRGGPPVHRSAAVVHWLLLPLSAATVGCARPRRPSGGEAHRLPHRTQAAGGKGGNGGSSSSKTVWERTPPRCSPSRPTTRTSQCWMRSRNRSPPASGSR